MNTIRSVGYGWGILIVAGAGSYYFAKRSVNSDRAERAEAEERRRQQRERLRVQEQMHARGLTDAGTGSGARSGPSNAKRKENVALGNGQSYDPSLQAQGGDPAPVTHEQENMSKRGVYEAAEPFRSRKGDRFS